jgi:hypothetical protein
MADEDHAYRRGLAALKLAGDIEACQALTAGIPVNRSRLVRATLDAIGEPADGEPLALDDELALRIEAARPASAAELERRRRETTKVGPGRRGSVSVPDPGIENGAAADTRDRSEDRDPAAGPWWPRPLAEAAAAAPLVRAEYGRGLIYPGALTIVSGEPGVGKSMYLTTLLVDEAREGRSVVYFDFERRPELLLDRVKAAGLDDETLAERVRYQRPEEPERPEALAAIVELLAPDLVLVDAFDSALALHNLETTNEDVRRFSTDVLDPLRSTGAAVVVADHVPKARAARGRYPIGGQAKLGLAEAHLGLVVAKGALRRGGEGRLRIRTHKDTYGHLPPSAVFTLASHETTGALSWQIRAADEGETDAADFRPTGLMESVSRYLETATEPLTGKTIETDVHGRAEYVRQALVVLVRESYVDEEQGPHSARLFRSVNPYREADQ